MTPALEVRTYLLGQRRQRRAHVDHTQRARAPAAPIGFSVIGVDGAKSAHTVRNA
jgi:phage-related baseplate assembly protein